MLPVPAPSSNAEQIAEFSGSGAGWNSDPMPVLVSGFFVDMCNRNTFCCTIFARSAHAF